MIDPILSLLPGLVRGEAVRRPCRSDSDQIWNEDRVREDHGKRTTRNDD